MPKRERDFQKRRLGYVLGCLDKALEHALELKIAFDEAAGVDPMSETYADDVTALVETVPHARYALLIYLAMTQALMAQQSFREFALHAWGSVPDSISRLTNTGQDWRDAQEE